MYVTFLFMSNPLTNRRSLLIAIGLCMSCGQFLAEDKQRLCEICLYEGRMKARRRYVPSRRTIERQESIQQKIMFLEREIEATKGKLSRLQTMEQMEFPKIRAYKHKNTRLEQMASLVESGICLECRVNRKPERDTICSECRNKRNRMAHEIYTKSLGNSVYFSPATKTVKNLNS